MKTLEKNWFILANSSKGHSQSCQGRHGSRSGRPLATMTLRKQSAMRDATQVAFSFF